jgi:hypothetical protein
MENRRFLEVIPVAVAAQVKFCKERRRCGNFEQLMFKGHLAVDCELANLVATFDKIAKRIEVCQL